MRGRQDRRLLRRFITNSMTHYDDAIAGGLDVALKAKKSVDAVLDVDEIKLVVFSDQHKGQRDGADDFLPCKPAYHAALGYYREAGYSLVLLGDVEELWECRPHAVMEAYTDTLKLEGSFAGAGGYVRVTGNHDEVWRDGRNFKAHMRDLFPVGCTDIAIDNSFLIEVVSKGESLGRIFFVHGHQGTSDSDRYAGISRFFVRHVWRRIQRLAGIRSTTPARDFELRRDHELAMYGWANRQHSLLLVAGHTHRPVFSAETHERFLRNELADKRKELESNGGAERRSAVQAEINGLQARLEWVLAKSDGVRTALPVESSPCYFNAGCCSFSDGDITGIEIENGFIRLVRWPDDSGRPKKKVLRIGNLRDILRRCR